MPTVHPSAIVSPEADLAPDAQIGPFCVLEGPVRLATGVRLISGVHLRGRVDVGEGSTLYPGVCVGFPAQHLKIDHDADNAGVRIGARCTLREHVTVHSPMPNTDGQHEHPTTLGDRVYMMATAHVGHDARVEDDAILVNGALVGGHAHVASGVNMGGLSAVHQFTRVGRLVMLSGMMGVSMDVPPFCLVSEHNRLFGINAVGMRRAGIPREEITAAREAFRRAFKPELTPDRIREELDRLATSSACVAEMRDFVAEAKRPVCFGPSRPQRGMMPMIKALRRQQDDLAPAATFDDDRDEL
ncbi:MAG: acyl-[acyl-carrier-protein]--UDP-N-acetylglucosamine O-acyltransferase [Phycisphaerales bacterium]|nr:MAG: acyl-[acyl-carrier-protein]--UDP-N-acetylglucosamine O-acyltransferase [Phycisphaerales bacterium]